MTNQSEAKVVVIVEALIDFTMTTMLTNTKYQ
jgi:hypothetical protein